jgi:hypothetical protein
MFRQSCVGIFVDSNLSSFYRFYYEQTVTKNETIQLYIIGHVQAKSE